MNREESHNKANNEYVTAKSLPEYSECLSRYQVENLLDDIFDDNESDTCGNCRYFEELNNVNIGFCEGDVIGMVGALKVTDFCSKFERKQDE